MYYGGAFFDPNPPAQRISFGALVTSFGILIGGLTLLAGVLLPWRVRTMVGPIGDPPNGFAAAGALGITLAVLGTALFLGAFANVISPSRPFTLGLQVFAIVAGVTTM